jgi:chemotaxis protein methyltransferase CheR
MLHTQRSSFGGSLPKLDPFDFERFSRLLMDRYGLDFSGNRHIELEIAVVQSFAASTFTDLPAYYQFLLEELDGGAEMERLVNVATINETHFFRDSAQMDALFYNALPELIQRRRSIRTLRIWSAGCASGEEPYSVAILLRELLPDIDDWAVTILGTDINTSALARARTAQYGEWSFREDKAKILRDRYFNWKGNRWELAPEVRRMVSFSRLNLASAVYPSYDTNTNFMDLILCRNVLLYLGEAITHSIVERFYNSLQGGGWLAVAPSEAPFQVFQRFKVHNFPSAVLHQRAGQSATLSLDRVRLTSAGTRGTGRLSLRGTGALSGKGLVASNVKEAHPQPVAEPPAQSPAARLLLEAQDLIEYGHSEKARDMLLTMAPPEGDQAKVATLLGQAYANLGDWEQAEQWCQRAIRLTKLSVDTYYTLGLVFQHRNNILQAIDMMKKVIYLDRNDVLGHFGLANLYHENGQLARAIKSLDNALHLLDSRPAEDVVPRSGGVTIRRLREAIILQGQHWNGEASLP